ncbi:3-oxoacyl-ACP reductase FabG [Patulibacter minatonensis]|uniref:3-oxoacyl-ACP reductase FabG n=1 Tax=Patulibacter minatonensis TaxID=298163 RepID=UPI000479F8CE|nr:3-oxoacyl-ACP reductase FabG [Patulibacter minatonensis]
MSARFAERVALVTGAAGGIGAAVARRLTSEGATVVLLDRELDAAKAVAAPLVDAGGSAWAVQADVSSRDDVERAISEVIDHHGRIDVLVNNAGITRDDLLFRLSEDDWDAVIDVNLKSVFLCTQAVQRHMVKAKSGAVVSLSSRSALGNRGQSNYAAAKAGIKGLTATMALELGPFGIRVNAVAPGYIATDMTRATARRQGLDPAELEASTAERTPLRRVGQPEDVASVIAFLASDDARHVTGQTLAIDGGLR